MAGDNWSNEQWNFYLVFHFILFREKHGKRSLSWDQLVQLFWSLSSSLLSTKQIINVSASVKYSKYYYSLYHFHGTTMHMSSEVKSFSFRMFRENANFTFWVLPPAWCWLCSYCSGWATSDISSVHIDNKHREQRVNVIIVIILYIPSSIY